MDKINFQNLPSQTTPINASNLNQIQTNVDTAKVEKMITINNVDLNDQKITGFYFCGTCTNRPIEANGYLVVIRYTDNYAKQFYYTYNTNIGFERVLNYGTWNDWAKISREEIITINSYLENSWSTNGNNNAVILPGGTKILTISVRNGTSTQIMTLPTGLKPSTTVLAIGSNGTAVGNITITTDGKVTVASSIFTSGSSNCIFSVMYS